MRYTLMNKEIPVLSFETQITENGRSVVINEQLLNNELLPISYNGSIKNYISKRKAPKHRKHILKLMRQLDADTIDGYIRITNGASLTDTFWIRNEDNPKCWDEVSFYRNEFDENIAQIAIDGGNASISTTSPELSVNGQYAKCWIRENNSLYLLKRGDELFGEREVCAEYYASQIFSALCNNSVHYDITMHHNKPASKCEIFTSEKYGYLPFAYAVRNRSGSTEALDFLDEALRYSDGSLYRRMVVADALTLNIDRHLGNFGFLMDNDTLKIVDFAPVFDFNRCMLFNLTHDQFMREDMDDLFAAPCTDGDFVPNAQDMLTDEIKSDLKNLQGFTFRKSGIDDWPDNRLHKYEVFIDSQIDKILGRSRVIINDIPPIRRTPSVSKSNKAKPPEIER